MAKQTKKPARELPPDVLLSDLAYPKFDSGDSIPYQELDNFGLSAGTITFYKTKSCGWVVTTLHISNPSRRQAPGTAARTYAIGVADEKVYTVGRGPHVLEEVTIYLKKSNMGRLKKYVELYAKGLELAGSIRDRISSRRAQGQLRRGSNFGLW